MRARPNPLATAAPLPYERDEPKTSYLPPVGLPSSRPSPRSSEAGFRSGAESFRERAGGDGFRGEPGFRGDPYRGAGVDPLFRGIGGLKETSPPQLVVSGVGSEVSLADFHHFLSRWGQVVDSSVTMQGYGTVTYATWQGTDALLAASPLRFKGMELTVRPPSRAASPYRRRYEEGPPAMVAREQVYRDLPPLYPTSSSRGGYPEPVGIRDTDRPRVARMTPGPRPRNSDNGLNSHGEPKLYVGGVSTSTAEELKTFMEQFGEVQDSVVMPKGFGFCTFKEASGTTAALAATNLEFDGQSLTIQKARPKGGLEEEAKAGGQPKLYVAGVGKETSNADFKTAMSICGEVFDCIVMPSGFGFCTFANAEGTETALRTKITIGDKKLTCQRANPKQGEGKGGRDGRDSRDGRESRDRGDDYYRDDYRERDYDRGYDRGYDRYDRGEYDRYYDRYEDDRYDRRYPPRDYRGYERYPSPPRYSERRPAPNPAACDEPKLYVGGVPNELSNDDFREFLSQYGQVHDCVVMGGGFGFVTFSDSAATYKALGATMEIDGKKLTVQKAKPKKNGSRDEWTTSHFESKRRRD